MRHVLGIAVASLLSLAFANGAAHAQETPPARDQPSDAAPAPAPAKKRKTRDKESAGKTPVSAAELDEFWDAREILRRVELAAMAHGERWPDSSADRVQRTGELVERTLKRRTKLGKILQRRLPKGALAASALHLLAELRLDQWASLTRLGVMAGNERELPAAGRHKRAAVRWFERLVELHPSYAKLGLVLDEISQHYFDLGNHDKAKVALQRMLCGNHDKRLAEAEQVQGKADNRYQARVYAQSVALSSYRHCVPRVTDRELLDDGWMRLGWLHREGRGELALAVSAYEQATADPSSPSYFTALEELAATYYESGQLIDAIPPLDLMVEYLDEERRARPDEFDETLLEVRAGAVRKSAGILAELWRESALPKADASLELANIYFRGRAQGHVRDVFEELGSSLRGLGAFEQAVTVWTHMISRWPKDPRAPVVHDKLVKLLIETGNLSAADAQRERLVARFDTGTSWRAANEASSEALERADLVLGETLHALATSRFREAIKRSQGIAGKKLSKADVELYQRAAAQVRIVVDRFPKGERGYVAGFQLAQLELLQGRYLDAAHRFRWVREREPMGRHALDATRRMVEAYQQELSRVRADKTLVLPPLPTQAVLASKPTAVELPTLVDELRRAYDELGAESSSAERAATVLVAAADLSLRYLRISEAEARYKTVVREHCQAPPAHRAALRLSVINAARGAQTVRQHAQALLNRACGNNAPVQLVRKARVKRLLTEARRLRAADRHLDAGRSFYEAHRKSAPKDAQYAPTLLAAAESFSAGGRAEVAATLLSAFAKESKLAASPLAPKAYWQLAQVHEQLFDYQRAVDAYLALDARKGAAPPGFDLAGKKLEALWRAAELREVDRIYYDRGPDDPGAVTLFLRYAKRIKKDRPRASEAYLRAAKVYGRAGDPRKLEATFKAWRASYGKARATARYRVHFQHAIALARLATGDRRGAARAFLGVVDAHRALGSGASKKFEAESKLAAEAAFWRAEDAYQREFKGHLFRWPENGDEKLSKARVKALLAAESKGERQFKKVLLYDTEWSIAANVRIGDLHLGTFDKLLSAPPPKKLIEALKREGIEHLETFTEELRVAILPFLHNAEKRWIRARKGARRRGVSSVWTRAALQSLNTHIDADRYPVQRSEVVVVEQSP